MLNRMTNIDLYLDYCNNFLTLPAMEEYYGVDVSDRVNAGRVEYKNLINDSDNDIEFILSRSECTVGISSLSTKGDNY